MDDTTTLKITADTTQAQFQLTKLSAALKSAFSPQTSGRDPFGSLGASATQAAKASHAAAAGVDRMQSAFGGLNTTVLTFRALAASALAAFAKESIDSAAKAERAFKGLESVANRTGVGIEGAYKAVKRITADGVMNDADASKALQNLLTYGFSLQQAEAIMGRLKDSAAFGRQASLGWSEAIVSATEGIRQENSVLVDNAGVTRNVAKMYEDYAKTVDGANAASLSRRQKIEALNRGIMKETANQVGDADKALKGIDGTTTKLSKSWVDLKTTVGGELTPAFKGLGEALAFSMDKLAGIVELGGAFSKMSGVFDFEQFGESIDNVLAAESFDDFRKRQQATQRKAMAAAGERARKGLARFGIDIPPPPGTAGVQLPPPVPGVKNNIDQAQVDEDRRKKEEEDRREEAKQKLGMQAIVLEGYKSLLNDQAALQRRAREVELAALDEQLAKELISRESYAQKSLAIDLANLKDEQAYRESQIEKVEEYRALAELAGDAEKLRSLNNELDHERRLREQNAQQILALEARGRKDEFEGRRADEARSRQIAQASLEARLAAEEKAQAASTASQMATLEAQKSARLISEEDYIRRATALDIAKLDGEKARILERIAFEKSKKAAGATDAAAISASIVKLQADLAAASDAQATIGIQGEARLSQAAIETANLRQELEQRLSEAEGRTFEARARQIDAFLDAKRRELAAYPELLATAESIGAAEKNKLAFDIAQDAVARKEASLSTSEADINRRVQAGQLTQLEGERQIRDARLATADAMRKSVEEAKRLAAASKDPALMQSAVEAEQRYLDLAGTLDTVAVSLNETFFGSVKQGFQDLISGAKSFGDVLKNIISSVLSKLAELALNQAIGGMSSAAGGSGGGLGGLISAGLAAFGYAEGGAVEGPGTGTSDSIVARLSNGEFVLRAAAVRALGLGRLNFMNKFGKMPAFATGGLVGSGGQGLVGSITTQASPVNANISVSPSVTIAAGQVADALAKESSFHRAVIAIVGENGRGIRSAWGN
ncbi:hypothetical protein D3C71_328690 [compost metagenome]